jgi:hypothetical protein
VSTIALSGLRAENPLSFLAALGVISLLHDVLEERPRMSWVQHAGTWAPLLHSGCLDSPDGLVEALASAHRQRDLDAELGWEKDIMKVTREQMRDQLSLRDLHSESIRLLTACVAELPLRRDGERVHYTPFRLMPRVGRARFLDTAMRESHNGVEHLQSCLFETWDYAPDTQSMRWDPASLIPSRALMAEAPTHAKPRGVPGAILLAIRGLASFPLITQRYRAVPTGMVDRSRFVWPIWRDPLQLAVVRMLLSMRWLYELDKTSRSHDSTDTEERRQQIQEQFTGRRRQRRKRTDIEAQLRAHGVIATFSAPRVRRGDDDEALGWGVPRVVGDQHSGNAKV